jgi:hypothetical protein
VLKSSLAALYRDAGDQTERSRFRGTEAEQSRVRRIQFTYYDAVGHPSVQLVFDLLNAPENAEEEQQRFNALIAAEVRQAFSLAATALIRPLHAARADHLLEIGIRFRLKVETMSQEFSPSSLARQTFAIPSFDC